MTQAIESLDITPSLALVDGVKVDYYGSSTPLNQVASLSVPDPTTIAIAPWEPGILGDIEKAILKSNLGLTPNNDGSVIRITIPALTEERRLDFVKKVKRLGEEVLVALQGRSPTVSPLWWF